MISRTDPVSGEAIGIREGAIGGMGKGYGEREEVWCPYNTACLCVCVPVCLCVCAFDYVSVCLSVCLSVFLNFSVYNIAPSMTTIPDRSTDRRIIDDDAKPIRPLDISSTDPCIIHVVGDAWATTSFARVASHMS